MQFRFTVYSDVITPLGTTVNQPVGWKDCRLVLERHPDYHTLIEYFEGEFIFFGSGRALLQQIEDAQGPDAKPRIVIELSTTLNVWDELFDGIIDLSLLEEFSYGRQMYKMKVPIIRNDFWTKFINRKTIPVDLSADVDLDGNERTPISPINLAMPSQVINTYYRADMESANKSDRTPIQYDFDTSSGFRIGQIDLPIKIREEVEDVFILPASVLDTSGWGSNWGPNLTPNFTAKYKGTYAFEFNIILSTSPYTVPYGAGNKVSSALGIQIYRNGVSIGFATATDQGTDGLTGRTTYHYSNSFDLAVGESITYIIYSGIGVSDSYFIVFNDWFTGTGSFISITASTTFEDTAADSYKLLQAAESIISKMVGADDVVESTALSGCSGKYAIQKALQTRGYTLEEKPFAMSFDDFWQGINPILNLCLGYTSDDKIFIEDKAYAYNPEVSINLSNVSDIVRTYDLDKYYKTIQVGYYKGLSESAGGIDDPQTDATWRTRFSSIGKDEKLLSKLIAASLAIEQTRRNRVESGKDWRLDEEVFILALNDSDEIEVGTVFELVTNLLNYETRYNIRLSCARNFERWRNWFNGCLQHDLTQKFYYATGTGNRTMTSEVGVDDCDYGENPTLAENQDINVTSDAILIPKLYKFNHPLTISQYNTIKNSPNNAIGLSRGTDSHTPHFIQRLEYYLTKGRANFSVHLATAPTEENGFRLLEDGNYRLLEDGQRRLIN
jgi:hypothetical protein